jgi:Fe-S-cluster containining protein
MALLDPANPLAFFHALAGEFAATLTQKRTAPALVDALMQQASETFETNVAHQSEGQEALACRGGCAACCALRVTATAPEIFAVAAHLRAIATAMPAFGRVLRQRIEAAALKGGQGDAEYLALAEPCAFIVDGHCVIYDLRPLACRGHASFDEAACIAAIEGHGEEVPISQPHHLLRSYVQNALQSALRDAGLAWAIHEFVPGLALALSADAAAAWSRGEDPLAASRAADVSLAEMAATFDEIKALAKRSLAEVP